MNKYSYKRQYKEGKTNEGINQMYITITVANHKLNEYYSSRIIQIHLNLKEYFKSDEIIETKNISLIYLNLKRFADHLYQ